MNRRRGFGPRSLEAPEGRVVLSAVANFNYTVRAGPGAYRGATGSGTVTMTFTPTGESIEGIVNYGVLEPADVAGTVTLSFQ